MDLGELITRYATQKKETGMGEATLRKLLGRLTESIHIFQEAGIAIPKENDFQEILKPRIEAKRKRNGEIYSPSVVRDWINATAKFYEWARNTADTQTAEIEDIPAHQEQLTIPDTKNTVDNKPKLGRPKSSGRTEKFTLYVRPETWQNLNMLADYDETTITELMNGILESYFTSRADDLEFLAHIEQQKRERRLNQRNNNPD